ncbi:MAG: glutathione S-transferase, partial [Burkholderiaceae bacterium]|nr:glutathione S-transferase [Burkholderiaceae bacterium]
MITLCGIAISNYYNKVKLALLEKGLAFEEEHVATGSKDEAVLACSPLAKVPFIRTPEGPLCESEAIMAYLEALQPTPPLLPASPYAAAKVRELTIFIELHVELVARELYG